MNKAEKIINSSTEKERKEFYNEVKFGFEREYNLNDNNKDRIEKILSGIKVFFDMDDSPLDTEEIKEAFRACTGETKEEFIESLMVAVKPFIDLKVSDPVLFEEWERSLFMTGDKDHKINQLVGYEEDDDGWLNMHFASNKYISSDQKRKLPKMFVESMRHLAELAKKDESIRGINAESWIVAKHPKMVERYGFEVTGEVPEQEIEGEEPIKTEEMWGAFITRDKLIEKFG